MSKRDVVSVPRIQNRIRRELDDWQNGRRLEAISRAVAANAFLHQGQKPVIFFRASTGILHLSLNAAFSVLAAMGLRLSGIPTIQFMCRTGMSRCVQGTRKEDVSVSPPCRDCAAHSRRIYAHSIRREFTFLRNENLAGELSR